MRWRRLGTHSHRKESGWRKLGIYVERSGGEMDREVKVEVQEAENRDSHWKQTEVEVEVTLAESRHLGRLRFE